MAFGWHPRLRAFELRRPIGGLQRRAPDNQPFHPSTERPGGDLSLPSSRKFKDVLRSNDYRLPVPPFRGQHKRGLGDVDKIIDA